MSLSSIIRSFCAVIGITAALLLSHAWAEQDEATQPEADGKFVVLVSLAPIHSLVAGIMDGVGTPRLLLQSNLDPHHARLKPADMKAIEKADLVIINSLHMEYYLKSVMASLGVKKPLVVETLMVPGLTLHPSLLRDEPDEEDPEMEEEDDIPSQPVRAQMKGPTPDFHFWLDPMNAIALTQYLTQILSEKDPKNSKQYQANAQKQVAALTALHQEIVKQMDIIGKERKSAYITYHPFLQYFEKRYKISPSATLTNTADAMVKTENAEALEMLAKDGYLKCIFAEPQFAAKALRAASKNYKIPLKTVGALGSAHNNGKTLYFNLMRDIARETSRCITAKPA